MVPSAKKPDGIGLDETPQDDDREFCYCGDSGRVVTEDVGDSGRVGLSGMMSNDGRLIVQSPPNAEMAASRGRDSGAEERNTADST